MLATGPGGPRATPLYPPTEDGRKWQVPKYLKPNLHITSWLFLRTVPLVTQRRVSQERLYLTPPPTTTYQKPLAQLTYISSSPSPNGGRGRARSAWLSPGTHGTLPGSVSASSRREAQTDGIRTLGPSAVFWGYGLRSKGDHCKILEHVNAVICLRISLLQFHSSIGSCLFHCLVWNFKNIWDSFKFSC